MPKNQTHQHTHTYSQTKEEADAAVAADDDEYPKHTYDDEGKWKIIRQNEIKQPKRYQYL